jgi:hypothetical protein
MMTRFIPIAWPHRPKLPQEALDQLCSLIETYRMVRLASQDAPNSDREIARLDNLLKSDPTQLWWSDMALAELCVVAVLPIPELRASLVAWRRRLCDVVGEGRYAEYLTTATDALHEQDVEALRADLASCIRGVYYFYGSYGVAALSRTQVTQRLIKWASGILAVQAGIVLLLWIPWTANLSADFLGWRTIVSVALATSMAAVLGSIVSVQRRLQDPTVNVDPFYRFVQTNADWFGTAVISPLFAAVFGLIIYGLLVSNFLTTSVVHLGAAIKGFPDWATDAIPSGPNSYAAVLILGFISGFAEQLIPDALTRIASRALSGVSPTEPPQKATPLIGPSGNGAPVAGVVPPKAPASQQTGANAAQSTAIIGATVLQGDAPLQATNEAAVLGHDPMLASSATAQELSTGVVE